MPEFDPEVIDDVDRIAAADRTDLLRGLAGAGALLRQTDSLLTDQIPSLTLDSAPRALLVAMDLGGDTIADCLRVLAADAAPVVTIRSPRLPRWAGPADALVVISGDGRSLRLAELTADAERRGLALFVAAPGGSPVFSAARTPAADLSRLRAGHPRALWWPALALGIHALATLALTDRRATLADLADAVEEVASINRPDASAYTAPAKVMASELADGSVVVAGAGTLATVAARRIAETLTTLAGVAAQAVVLPDDIAQFGGLLAGSVTETDIFADPVDPASAPPRLLVVGDDEPAGSGGDPVWQALGDEADRRAADVVLQLAAAHGIRRSRVETPTADPLVRFGTAVAIGEFAASYLALARGVDPGAVRPGELVESEYS